MYLPIAGIWWMQRLLLLCAFNSCEHMFVTAGRCTFAVSPRTSNLSREQTSWDEPEEEPAVPTPMKTHQVRRAPRSCLLFSDIHRVVRHEFVLQGRSVNAESWERSLPKLWSDDIWALQDWHRGGDSAHIAVSTWHPYKMGLPGTVPSVTGTVEAVYLCTTRKLLRRRLQPN